MSATSAHASLFGGCVIGVLLFLRIISADAERTTRGRRRERGKRLWSIVRDNQLRKQVRGARREQYAVAIMTDGAEKIRHFDARAKHGPIARRARTQTRPSIHERRPGDR